MRRASLLLPALAAAVLAATPAARAEGNRFSPGNPPGFRVRSGSRIRPSIRSRASSISCAARPRSRAGISSSAAAPRPAGRIPEPPSFASDAIEADPWFTPDGASLYFISTRRSTGKKGKDLDIWRVERDRWRLLGRARAIAGAREFAARRSGSRASRRMDRSTSDRSGPAVSAATTSGARGATRRAAGPSRISARPSTRAGDEYEPLPTRRRQTPDRRDGRRLL